MQASDNNWESLVPEVPIEPNPKNFRHFKHGDPVAIYPYKNGDGIIVGYQRRFHLDDGEKTFSPLSYGRLNGAKGWYAKAITGRRPVFNLEEIVANPTAPVVIVEGEKTVAKVKHYFPDHVGITSMGGAKAAGCTDWTVLTGRNVAIVPDCDDAGLKYAAKVAALVKQAGATSVSIAQLDERFPKGWDLADPLPAGVSAEVFAGLVNGILHTPQQAIDDADIAALAVREPYRLTATYVVFDEFDGKKVVSHTICSRIEVISYTRDLSGGNWGAVVRFPDREGRSHELAIAFRKFAGDGTEVRELLLDRGLIIESGPKGSRHLSGYLTSCRPQSIRQSVEQTGWYLTDQGRSFVFPDCEIGNAQLVLQADNVAKGYGSAGTLEEWNKHIGQFAVGNSRLAVCICADLAAPLLAIAGEEGGGVHLVGGSSIGKTTCLIFGASVWGGANSGFVRTWRATGNGLEAVAAEHNDSLLPLDEIGQCDSREVGEIAYLLASGYGKGRANRQGGARKPVSWRVFVLSTGELGLADKIMEVPGQRVRAGQEARILDIPADTGSGHGIFDDLHGFGSGADLSEHLQKAAKSYFGTLSRAFIAKLIEKGDPWVQQTCAAIKRNFVNACKIEGSDGQIYRSAARFAVLAAGGEIAVEFGLLTWPKGWAIEAALVCFKAWMGHRGGEGPGEELALFRQIRSILEQFGDSRFTLIREDGEANADILTHKRLGFRDAKRDGVHYFVLPEVMRTEMCKGFEPKAAIKALLKRGYLKPGEDGRAQVKQRLPGFRDGKRVYQLLPAIMGDAAQ